VEPSGEWSVKRSKPITAPRSRASGQKVERVLQPFTPRHRGTGFYSTDHQEPKAKEQPKGGE